MIQLTASSVPDQPPQNKPLISIMKQLEFHGKRIPDAGGAEADFGIIDAQRRGMALRCPFGGHFGDSGGGGRRSRLRGLLRGLDSVFGDLNARRGHLAPRPSQQR